MELVQPHVLYSVKSRFMGLHAANEMPATQPYWEGHTCHQYGRAEILCAVQNLLLVLTAPHAPESLFPWSWGPYTISCDEPS